MQVSDIFRYLVELPWLIFVIYWTIGALKTRATSEKESFISRGATVLLEIIGYMFLFSSLADIGLLGSKIIPRTLIAAIVGSLLTWAGIGLCIWARYHLAENWSARVTIKQDHQLIRTGPYRWFRHPIYSGLILASIGSALVIDHWRCVLGIFLVTMGYCFKAAREEKMLTQQFGEHFREHQRHTGFLIPRFR